MLLDLRKKTFQENQVVIAFPRTILILLNLLLSLLTFGEGWHNNHHRYPASARQGFQWWQIDISYYVLRLMAALGLVWHLKPVPARVIAQGRPH